MAVNIDRTKVTFSQAEGIEPLPGPLQLRELSGRLRNLIWGVVFESLDHSKHWIVTNEFLGQGYYRLVEPWLAILKAKHIIFDGNPIDEFGVTYEPHRDKIKALIQKAEYNRVFDCLQYILRHEDCPSDLMESLNLVFDTEQAAYRIIPEGPTIIATALEEEVKTLEQAFLVLKSERIEGARKHLRIAAEHLTQGHCADSVRESIHSVESVVKIISGDHSADLRIALDSIAKTIPIHGAFKEALGRLYGYTSNEKGIRHSLLDENAKVDSVDAQFMIGACASFISYLIGKARAGELLKDGSRQWH